MAIPPFLICNDVLPAQYFQELGDQDSRNRAKRVLLYRL